MMWFFTLGFIQSSGYQGRACRACMESCWVLMLRQLCLLDKIFDDTMFRENQTARLEGLGEKRIPGIPLDPTEWLCCSLIWCLSSGFVILSFPPEAALCLKGLLKEQLLSFSFSFFFSGWPGISQPPATVASQCASPLASPSSPAFETGATFSPADQSLSLPCALGQQPASQWLL